MKANEFVRGQIYVMKKAYDGHRSGSEVVFSHLVEFDNREAVVVSPVGEPDTQSMMMMYPEELAKASIVSKSDVEASGNALEKWMQEVTDVLCYQPEIPMSHKQSLVDAYASYRKSIGKPLKK